MVHHTVERDQDVIEVLDMLLSIGASLNETQYSKHSRSWNHEFFKGLGAPLHRATELGKLDVVQHLLEKQADRDIKDSKGRTPLDIARNMGHKDLIRLLESH